MDWTSVKEKVVVSVIVAAILGALAYGFNWLTTANPLLVVAGLEAFEIKNPLDGLDSKAIQELGRVGSTVFGTADFGKGLESLRFGQKVSVGRLNFVNGTNTRSKE